MWVADVGREFSIIQWVTDGNSRCLCFSPWQEFWRKNSNPKSSHWKREARRGWCSSGTTNCLCTSKLLCFVASFQTWTQIWLCQSFPIMGIYALCDAQSMSLKCWDLFLDSTSICVPLNCFNCPLSSLPSGPDERCNHPGAGWLQWSQNILKLFLQLGGTRQCCRVHTKTLPSKPNWRCAVALPCSSLPVGRLLSWVRWKRHKTLLQDGEANF